MFSVQCAVCSVQCVVCSLQCVVCSVVHISNLPGLQGGKDSGSGVEILVNEPYSDKPGPGPSGQFTHKVYHIGSHLPGWFKSLLPASALTVEERAWNAYPYTKTVFR